MPFCISAWVKTESIDATRTISRILGSASNFQLRVDATSGTISAVQGSRVATTTVGSSVGQIIHACGIFTSTISRHAYINGGNKGSNTLSAASSTCDSIRIGAGDSLGTPANFYDGVIDSIAIIKGTVTDAQVALLAKGIHPLAIFPGSALFEEWNFIGGNLRGRKGTLLTNNASTAPVNSFGRLYFTRTRHRLQPFQAASGTAFSVDLLSSALTSHSAQTTIGFQRDLTNSLLAQDVRSVFAGFATDYLARSLMTGEQNSMAALSMALVLALAESEASSGATGIFVAHVAAQKLFGAQEVAVAMAADSTLLLENRQSSSQNVRVDWSPQQRSESIHGQLQSASANRFPSLGMVVSENSSQSVSLLSALDSVLTLSASHAMNQDAQVSMFTAIVFDQREAVDSATAIDFVLSSGEDFVQQVLHACAAHWSVSFGLDELLGIAQIVPNVIFVDLSLGTIQVFSGEIPTGFFMDIGMSVGHAIRNDARMDSIRLEARVVLVEGRSKSIYIIR